VSGIAPLAAYMTMVPEFIIQGLGSS